MMGKGWFWLLLASLVMFAAAGTGLGSDPTGSDDHPLLSRFPGSKIVFYHQLQFDESFVTTSPIVWSRDAEHNLVHELPLGPVESYRDEDHNLIREFSDSKILEGKITRMQYEAPHGKNPAQL